MTTEDRFVHDDAAYVLGALSAEERAAFEAHLQTCQECTARVRELADLPELLGSIPFAEVTEAVPDTLLPGLLRRARREQGRRRWLTGALAGLAAAALVALAVAVWPAGSAPGPHPQAMVAVAASPVHATAVVADRSWGTQISLDCRYDGYAQTDAAYGLTVVAKDGSAEPLGTWTLVAGRDIKFASGTALHRDQIKSIDITAPDGSPILQLTP
ncbi:MAG: anti-sigma factor family protein [Jatrophihabitantaceae bacterium]